MFIHGQGWVTHKWMYSYLCIPFSHTHTHNFVYIAQNALRVRNPNSTLPGSQYEGIVEVWHNGEWGTVCNTNWNYHTALVACRTAGFNSAVRAVLNASYYGRGVGDVLLDNIQCTGSESALWDCSRSRWNVTGASCRNHARDAAVICSDGERNFIWSIIGDISNCAILMKQLYTINKQCHTQRPV